MLYYSINVTLDGCCDHNAVEPSENMHRHANELLQRADALLFGRVTYQMMESAFRGAAAHAALPSSVMPFARTIDKARKYVVSSTLPAVDWNAELLRGDLEQAVRSLKSGGDVYVGGMQLPLALANLGLIDEFEFVVHPVLAGYGPTLFAGLARRVPLKHVGREELGAGVVAMRYVPGP